MWQRKFECYSPRINFKWRGSWIWIWMQNKAACTSLYASKTKMIPYIIEILILYGNVNCLDSVQEESAWIWIWASSPRSQASSHVNTVLLWSWFSRFSQFSVLLSLQPWIALRWQTATLTASPSLALSRDDLFRVELDSVAGDEMFYSKVSAIRASSIAFITFIWIYCLLLNSKFPFYSTEEYKCGAYLNMFFFFFHFSYGQKRTWESNKNDIRICRMKGKHEVRQPSFWTSSF